MSRAAGHEQVVEVFRVHVLGFRVQGVREQERERERERKREREKESARD